MTSSDTDPTAAPKAPRGRVRRRIFWSMLGVASVALVIAGIVAALVGQNIVGRQVRTEMVRQSEAIENLLGERLLEDPDSARLIVSILEGGQEVPAGEDGRGRGLSQLIRAARRLFGSPLVDLAFADIDGSIHYLTPTTEAFLVDHIESWAVTGRHDQFVTIRASEVEGERPFLVYVRSVPVAGYEHAPVQMAIIVARQSTLIDVGQVVRGMFIAFTVATLLSAAFSRLLARRVTRRLDGLADAATSLAAGNVHARAPVEGDDEVAGVAHAFNAMASQLQDLAIRERDFLMSVGHDLRTPLTTIAGYAEVLEEGDLGPSETDRIAAVLADETSRLRRLVEDLMLLARLEAREFTLETEDVDIGEHVRGLVEAFMPRAQAARVGLEINVTPTGLTHTDPDRIAQILGNLIENALRYSPEAGTVTVRVRPVEDEVELSVNDMGSGIEADDLPNVFEKFFVAQRYRRLRPEGSGLGLAIVKQLVDTLGGRVVMTSDVDQGTTVWVRIVGSARVAR